jgi:hypothetical protein
MQTCFILDADGRHIYVKAHNSQGCAAMWSVPLAGGEPRLLER